MRGTRWLPWLLAMLVAIAGAARVDAQSFLGRAEIELYGIGLTVEPSTQTVPKGYATIVSTFLRAPSQPGALPPFAPDAVVRATLRGPSFAEPIELVAQPNSPFNIPILTVPGTHTVDNIRLESGGQVLLYGSPESTRIEVIERLLVTTVTSRPLTADEIREKGIVYDKSNFQAYNFTAAFAIDNGSQINVAFPVVLPTIGALQDPNSAVGLQTLDVPQLKSLQTLIPDTLQIQARIPNLKVVGFQLALDDRAAGQDFFVPPIPGVIVIPGDIGFLNQYFSVLLMVANVAPDGSNLVVSDLTASLVLPPGQDRVVGSADDPLAMARRSDGEFPRVAAVTQPGPDGKLGTGDDVTTVGPGQTGNAEYLIEGRREGTHVVEMELAGTLNGLPIGPVPVRGRAAGAVLVRNPAFTLTFTHPDTVNAGEPYTLDVTVTNTSTSPANFVSLNLFSANVSGAALDDDATKTLESIAPGDSGTVSFRLISRRTGTVTAATLDSGDNVAGRFVLRSAVGELGVPLSPDSLILPKEAAGLPAGVKDAALGLLGRAWAVATAPPAALPKDLTRFSKQLVLDRAVETAEAGFRITLGEPVPRSVGTLLFDFLGSEYTQLASRVPPNDPSGLLALLQRDVTGFDLLRRRSVRGDVFAAAVGRELAPAIGGGATAWHQALAEQLTSRPGHVSVLISAPGGVPVDAVLVDADGARTGEVAGDKVRKDIPFSDAVPVRSAGGAVVAQLLVVAVPQSGNYAVELRRRGDAPADQPYDVSVAYPAPGGGLRFAAWSNVGPLAVPVLDRPSGEEPGLTFSLVGVPTAAASMATPVAVADAPPSVLGAFQIGDADQVGCPLDDRLYPVGRIVAVLFSEEVSAASVQDKLAATEITNIRAEGNRVVGVALQPGGRIAYVALREPVGPFVPRTITVSGVEDLGGHAMAAAQSVPITIAVGSEAGVVSGRVLQADGTPAVGAEIRLFYEFSCGGDVETYGIAEELTDASGAYQFDYVLKAPGMTARLVAVEPDAGNSRSVKFGLARAGQRLNVDVVLLGRGTLRGRTFAEDGRTPLAGTALRITSLTDQSQYAATADSTGAYEVPRVPVGNVLIEAVNTARPAQVLVSERVPFAGAVVTRDLALLDAVGRTIVVKTGQVTGRVVRADGVTPVGDVPVVAYYTSRSQDGVACSPPPGGTREPAECAIAVVRTDVQGRFSFDAVTAGALKINTFDQAALLDGTVRIVLSENEVRDVTVLVAGGFGTVRGVVLDSSRRPVPDAVVGGGYSLVNVGPDGTFVMTDVPVGRRRIVAASNALQAVGETTIDLVQQGEEVNTTIVLPPVGAVAGVVRNRDGAPQANIAVYVLQDCFDELGQENVCIIGEATTDQAGAYRIGKLGIGQYRVSAFRRDLKDGNIVPVAIRFDGQVLVTDITFRGGFGTVNGRVLRAESCPTPPCAETPLPARVSISGERLVTAGDRIGVRFEYVQNYKVVSNDTTTGFFEFGQDVWTGPFTVRAAGQFSPEPVAAEGVMPGPNQTVTVDLRLQPTSRITGTVFEPDGFTPVTDRQISLKFQSNAVVVFCSDDALTGFTTCTSIPQGIQEAFAATDASGQFSFPLVNAGPFTLTATDVATGRVAEVKGTVRPGDALDIPIRLLGRAPVTVRVFRSDGITPVSGARVELQGLDMPRDVRRGTATAGVIAFDGGDAVAEGPFVITAIDPNGFAGRKSGRVVADGTAVTVDVFLFDATGTVAGRVVAPDAAGALLPVPNAEVVISNASGPLAFTLADAAGVFAVPLVPVGPYTVEAFDAATAARGRASGIVLGGSQPAAVTISLEAMGSIRGTLLQSGTLQPLKGWTVQLNQTTFTGRALPTQYAQTGVDGTFTFPGASVGGFSLYASRRDFVGSASANGQVARGGQLVDVPMIVSITRRVVGTVTGLVTDAAGTPLPNASVEVCGAEGCRTTLGGGDGRFAMPDVPLGRFTVRASAQVTGNPSVGTSGGTLLFEGDTADVTIALLGLSSVEGTVYEVVNGARVPAANAVVRLFGQPGSGCAGACQQGTDANGRFRFVNVPARTFTVTATSLSGQQGSLGDELVPGQARTGLEVVVAPAVRVSGRAVLANGDPANGVVAELALGAGRLFAETAEDGSFAFDGVGAGAYTLRLQDPVGGGLARRTGTVQLTGPLTLGDIALDEVPPAVASSDPGAGAVGVLRAPTLTVTFTEPLDAATVTATSVTLLGPAGPVTGLVDTQNNDTVARFRLLPGSQLQDQARYTLRVSGVKDRVGRALPLDYVATFTTVDVTPPTIVETTPTAGGTGVTADAVVRVRFSEPVNINAFQAPAVQVAGPLGPVAGRIDPLFGNTMLVFTPNVPLADDTPYTVTLQPATDLSGQSQSSATTFAFQTTDRTPPVVLSVAVAGPGTLVENTTGRATATVASTDISVVDFFLNDTFAFADRIAPFTMDFVATPALAATGQIKVSAVATDTSGNRSPVPVSTFVAVVPDGAPTVTVTQPPPGFTPAPGQRVEVTVRATDDVGVAQVSYSARRGQVVIDAVTRAIAPAVPERSETFAFNVPLDAAPGSIVAVQASTRDTAGQQSAAPVLELRVRDTAGPAVEITGATSGQRVRPGSTVTVVVSAEDPSGVASIGFVASGVAVASQQRAVTPAQNRVATSFDVVVPAGATSAERLLLDAFAVDGAGNRADAARLILPVADQQAPTVAVRTASGLSTVVPGGSVAIVVTAADDLAVSSVRLSAAGAFVFDETRSLPVPQSSHSETFAVAVPATVPDGATVTFTARATDASGNQATPASISLTARAVSTLTLQPSLLLLAGDSGTLSVTLGAPAPAGGVRVDFVSSAPSVATVAPSLVFAEGETSRTLQVTAVAGGLAQVDALVDNAVRGTSTVTVNGGVIRGDVVVAGPGGIAPVPNAQVTVFHAGTPIAATTDAAGTFVVQDVLGTGFAGRDFSVSATDGTNLGFVSDQLDVPNGSARVTVVLLPVGAIAGVVLQPDAVTPAGAGVAVNLFEAAAPSVSIATAFTAEDGTYRFPLVAPGSYLVDAQDGAGNRGRASVQVSTTGQEQFAPVVFLGRGTVVVRVRSGLGQAVAGASVELRSDSLFGVAPARTGTTDGSGEVTFPNVFVGAVSATGRDPFTNQAGSISGQVPANGATTTLTVQLAAYGNLAGTVFRRDGTTRVPNATVTVNCGPGCRFSVLTDLNGDYRFDFLPLQAFTINVSDAATRGVAVDSGQFAVSGQTLTRNLVLLPQGALLVTVVDADGNPVNGATVAAQTTSAGLVDSLQGVTTTLDGQAGRVLLDRMLAGAYTVNVSANGLNGSATGVLSSDEVRPVTVQLEPRATISGAVFEPDGQTPATGSVVVRPLSGGTAATRPLVNGAFSATDLRLGSYRVDAYDPVGRFRAFATGIELTANGQEAQRTLSFVGLGTVRGRVLHPTGGDAGNLSVQLRSLNVDFGGYAGAQTDAAGNFEFSGVPVGEVRLSSAKPAELLIGEAAGALTQHNQAITLDILLEANAVNLPITYADVQDSSYSVGADGGLLGGTGQLFAFGATRLTLTANGTPVQFTGASFGTREDGGREVAVRQENLHGLNVTRKIFVPDTGYFARYLEVLQNPTGAPVQVGVRVASRLYGRFNRFGFENQVFVARTSSGDSVADASSPQTADRWVVTSAAGQDPYYTFDAGTPAAFVFSGQGAARAADLVSYASPQTLTYGWQSVTVPAGGTVALMHFVSLQANFGGAEASAQRLEQLPPEALAALSADEISAVVNFAVPPNGVSAVAALPSIGGSVVGQVFEGDGVTPVPGARVVFESTVPVLPRRWFYGTNGSGQFAFTGAAGRPVPIADFRLSAEYSVSSNNFSPQAQGAFATGATSTSLNVVFSQSGIMKGVVRRQDGTTVSGARVTLRFVNTVTTGADGRYFFGGVPSGNRVLEGTLDHPQGTGLQIVPQTLTVSPGQVRDDVLLIEPTGTITGTVRDAAGNLQPSRPVTLTRSNFYRQASTDTGGQFTFGEVPVGTFTLTSTDPVSGFPVSAQATVVADQTQVVPLQYIGKGALSVTVTRAGGDPLSGMTVQVSAAGLNTQTRASGADGVAGPFTDLPLGTALTVTASHPGLPTVLARSTTVTLSAASATTTLALPAFGSVSGVVRRPNGQSAGANVDVNLTNTGQSVPGAVVETTGSFFYSTRTNANGEFTFGPVPLNRLFRIRAYHPLTVIQFTRPYLDTADLAVTTDGQALTADTRYPALARLAITVQNAPGAPVVGAGVQTYDSVFSYFQDRGTTSGAGLVEAPQVVEGPVRIRVLQPGSTTQVLELATTQVTAADDGATVPIVVTPQSYTVALTGLITEADGLTPMNTFSVQLVRAIDETVLATTCVGCNGLPTGRFDFGTRTITGAGVVLRTFSPVGDGQRFERSVSAAASGAIDVTIDLPFYSVTLTGRVFARDGVTPVPGGVIFPKTFGGRSGFGTTVGADGTFTLGRAPYPVEGMRLELNMAGLPGGTFTVTTVPFTQSGQVVSTDLVLTAGVATTVTGTVTAGDGVFPLEGAPIELTIAGTGCTPGWRCGTSTDAAGRFSLRLILPDDGAFSVRARSPKYSGIEVSQPGSNLVQGATVDLGTLTLPMSVVAGTATSGARPVNDLSVVATSNGQAYFADSAFDGRWLFYELPAGTFTVTAQDYGAGTEASVQVDVPTSTSVVTGVPIQLPITGRVEVEVIGTNGDPDSAARVIVSRPSANFERQRSPYDTIGDGLFEFTGLALATYDVRAELEVCDPDCRTLTAYGSADVVDDVTTVHVLLRFDNLPQAVVRVLDGTGQPVVNETVQVWITALAGAGQGLERTITTNDDGVLAVAGVPEGSFVAAVRRESSGEVGYATGTASPTAGSTTTVTLSTSAFALYGSCIPSRPECPQNDGVVSLWSGDRYFAMGPRGDLVDVLRVEQGTIVSNGAFRYTGRLNVGAPVCCSPAVSIGGDGAEYTLAPVAAAGAPGIVVQRRMRPSASGSFVRLLDTFTNTTTNPITFTAQHATQPNQSSSWGAEVHPSATSPGYVVRYAGDNSAESFAVVYGGADAPVLPFLVYDDGFSMFASMTPLTLQPGESRSLLHFVVARNPDDVAGVEAAAQALGALADPEALAGLSRQDRLRVANFRIVVPPPGPGTLRVALTGPDGQPLTGARVAVTGPQVAEQRDVNDADSDGLFHFGGLPEGTYHVQARLDDCAFDPCELFTSADAPVSADETATLNLSFQALAQLRVRVLDEEGAPLANTALEVDVRGVSASGPLGSYRRSVQLTTDAAGSFDLANLPAGRNEVVVVVPTLDRGGAASATLTPVVPTDLDITLSAGVLRLVSSTIGRAGFDNFFYFVGDAGAVQGGFFDGTQITQLNSFNPAGELAGFGIPVCCSLFAVEVGREWTMSPMPLERAPGVLVTRRLFVPDAGGFLRYFDVITNTTPSAWTVPIGMWVTPGASTTVVADVTPSSTSGGYLVNRDPAGQASSFAVVYAGVNAPIVPARLLSDDQRVIQPTATLTVQPGQSLALLHYVLLRGPDNSGDAVAAAAALAGLTDPDVMLENLTPADRALIVNFQVPLP